MSKHETLSSRVFNTLKENISDLENRYGEVSYNRGKARFWAFATGMGIAEIIRRTLTLGEGFQPQQFFLVPEAIFTVFTFFEGGRLMRRAEKIQQRLSTSSLDK